MHFSCSLFAHLCGGHLEKGRAWIHLDLHHDEFGVQNLSSATRLLIEVCTAKYHTCTHLVSVTRSVNVCHVQILPGGERHVLGGTHATLLISLLFVRKTYYT